MIQSDPASRKEKDKKKMFNLNPNGSSGGTSPAEDPRLAGAQLPGLTGQALSACVMPGDLMHDR
jgi:hypothetical protein